MICIACARQEWIITSCVHGILQRILLLYDDFIPHQIDQWMKTNIHVHCMHALPISPKKTSTSVLITRLERLGGPQITHQIKQQSNSVPKFKNFLYHDTRALLHNKINIVQKNGYDHPSPLTWTQQWHIVACDVDIQYTFDLLFYVCAFGREILGHLSPCSKEYIHLIFHTLRQM